MQICLLKYKHPVKLVCERKQNTNAECAIQAQHATREHMSRVEDALGRSRGVSALAWDDVGFSHAVQKVQMSSDQSQTSQCNDTNFQKPVHSVSHS